MTTLASHSPGRTDADFEEHTYSKVTWRLIPFLFLCFVIAYLDRVNVSFAKLQMLRDLQVQRHRLRARRGHLLPRLLPLRGAEQPDPAEGRRAALDRPHHDHLGRALGR